MSFFPLLFSGLGVFELIKVYTSRKKWLNDRLTSGVTGQEIKLQFTDDYIIHDGPFSSGNIKWIGIKSIRLTNKGLILKPETGIAIYLPRTAFDNIDPN